jgi:hypothetical protein
MARQTRRPIFLIQPGAKGWVKAATFLSTAAVSVLIGPAALMAQEGAKPDPVPLFASKEPLVFTLRADFDQLKKDRSQESEEREGSLDLEVSGGATLSIPIQVKTRGKFRLRKENCAFPPLRLNLPEEGFEGTAFEGQDKLKLVTHCMENPNYEQNVVEEYLVYRIYNLFTDIGFQVRLAHVTYVDPEDEDDRETRIAFVLEDKDAMAARLDGSILTEQVPGGAPPSDYQQEAAGQMYLFQYLIGNEDWSHSHFHNVELIRVGWEYFPVPYDFDFSGFVDAPYALPNEETGVEDVRDRAYWGSCSDRIDYGALFARFNDKREAILDLIGSESLLIDRNIQSAQRYVEEFYEIINDQRKAERLILRACRK